MSIKQILKFTKDEFIYGGHLLSLGAASIIFTSAVLLDIKVTWDCLFVTYLGIQAIYLYDRYKKFEEDILTSPERANHLRKYLKYLPIIIFFIISIFVLILLTFDKIYSLLLSFFLLSLGFSYSIVFKDFTKKIGAFKEFFVALCWSFIIIFLIVYYSASLNFSVILIAIFIFLRLLIHEIIFDIKDLIGDKKRKLRTLPIITREVELLNILNLLNILSFLFLFFGFYLELFPLFSLALLLLIPYSLYSLKKIKSKKINNNFYYIFIDGEFILWSVFILLGKILL